VVEGEEKVVFALPCSAGVLLGHQSSETLEAGTGRDASVRILGVAVVGSLMHLRLGPEEVAQKGVASEEVSLGEVAQLLHWMVSLPSLAFCRKPFVLSGQARLRVHSSLT